MSTFILVTVLSASDVHTCPAHILDSQVVRSQPPGWTVNVQDRPRKLEKVMVYSGHPSRRESLIGQAVSGGGMKWSFSGTDVWVECRYSGSSAVLTRNLEPVKSCTFSPQAGGTSDRAKMTCVANDAKRK